MGASGQTRTSPGSVWEKAVKLGFMFVGVPSPKIVADRVRQFDFDAVELALPIDLAPLSKEYQSNAIDCARTCGVPVALHEPLPLALANRDRRVASAVRGRVLQALDLAVEAGLEVLTVHTTTTRTRNPLLPGWTRPNTRWLAHELDNNVTRDLDEAREVFVGLLRKVGPEAEQHGVTIAVENNFRDTRYFGERIDSIQDVLDLVQAAAVPGLGVCFDVFKAVSTEPDLPAAVRMCEGLLANAHLSDFEPADTTIGLERHALGQGSINWREVLGAFHDAGYDGAMTLEMLPTDQDLHASRRHFDAIRAELLAAEAPGAAHA